METGGRGSRASGSSRRSQWVARVGVRGCVESGNRGAWWCSCFMFPCLSCLLLREDPVSPAPLDCFLGFIPAFAGRTPASAPRSSICRVHSRGSSGCCLRLAYKIHGALERQDRERLPYVFLIISVPTFPRQTMEGRIPNDLVWLASVSNRATEEAIASRLLGEPWANDVRVHIRQAGFRVISARRADALMRRQLFDRVHALRLRDLRVVPAHARHRMTIRLRKARVPPRIAVTSDAPAAGTAARRRRERPILPHRHLVAPQSQTTACHHHHLRTLGAVPEPLPRTPARIAASRRTEGRRRCAGDPRAGGPRTSATHARPGRRGRRPARRLQRRQAGPRQRAEHPVRELRQIRLELRRVRTVGDRLPEHRLLLRRGRGSCRRSARGRWLLPRGRRRRCGCHRRHRPGTASRPQRRHRRTVQIPRCTTATRRLPVPNRRPRPRTEQTVCATRSEARRPQPQLNLTTRRPVQAQTLLDHRAVAAPHPNRAP